MTSHAADRLPAFLLGAGASAEAGLPLSRQITSLMVDSFASDFRYQRESAALNFIVAAIIHHDSRAGERPDTLPDIERVASSVELLASRFELEVSPFVGTWDPTVDAMETERARTPALLDRDLAKAIAGDSRAHSGQSPSSIIASIVDGRLKGRSSSMSSDRSLRDSLGPKPNGRELVRLLEKFVDQRTAGGRSAVFENLLNALVERLKDMLKVTDDASFAYLSPLAEMAKSDAGDGLLVGTLNYDLGIESMAQRYGCVLDRAIQHWDQTGELTPPTRGLRLLKLHGSVDWHRTSATAGLPAAGFNVLPGEPDVEPSNVNGLPFVVFGQREKLRAEGPFLDLFGAFQSELRERTDLIIAGYAFRDLHINEVVARWFNSDVTRRITIVDPFFPTERTSYGFPPSFRDVLLNRSRPNGRLDHPDPTQAANRVVIARQPISDFLAQLDPASPSARLDESFLQATIRREA